MPSRWSTATPDDRAARLALAVIGFKHKDYAEVAQAAVAVRQGTVHRPDRVAVRCLGGGGHATTRRAAKGPGGPERSKAAPKRWRSFHTALLLDYLGETAAADAAYKKALGSGAPTPRVVEAYGRFLERNGRAPDAAKLYHAHDERGRADERHPIRAWRASPRGKSPSA